MVDPLIGVTFGHLMLAVGLAEIAVALVCFFSKRRTLALGLVAWISTNFVVYRLGLWWMGWHRPCGCLGNLTDALHISPQAADNIMKAILAYLLIGSYMLLLRDWWKSWILRRISIGLSVMICLLLVGRHTAQAAEGIEVRGHYLGSRTHPGTGTPMPGTQTRVGFSGQFWEGGWRICCTNVNRKELWELLYWDGTNTYSMTSYSGHFLDHRSDSNLTFATVSPSAYYHPAVDNSGKVDFFFPWIAFGLSPRLAPLDNTNAPEIPLPWTVSRMSLGAFGYRWFIEPTIDGRFVRSANIVRDTTLDLDDEHELLRFELDYPFMESDRELYLHTLANRRSVTNGFLTGRYECTEWFTVNGTQVPRKARLECFLGWAGAHPFFTGELDTEEATAISAEPNLEQRPSGATFVRDYRFKRASKERIYKYAEYRLSPNEAWKAPDDRELLRQAKRHLQSGRHFADLSPARKYIIVILVVSLFGVPGCIFYFLFRNRQHQN